MERFKGELKEADFRFVDHNSRVFITGVPLSGKSTLSSIVTAQIADCTWQNMDILRLTAQMVEEQKPEESRNPFVNYGSCDSYAAVGDGTYSPEALVEGFLRYAEVVSSSLGFILPKLEVQGAKDVLFEGVQLTPEIVRGHVNGNTRLVIVTSTEDRLRRNAMGLFGSEQWLLDRYSTDKLLLLQKEILRQAAGFPKDKLLIVDNSNEILDSVGQILDYFLSSGLIEPRNS